MRGSEYFVRQAAVFWVNNNGSEKEFGMLKNSQRTETEQAVGIQQGQLSQWWQYEEASNIHWSMSHVSEPMGSKRDIES